MTTVLGLDDVIAAETVLSHRLLITPEADFNGVTVEKVMVRVLADVPPPRERAS